MPSKATHTRNERLHRASQRTHSASVKPTQELADYVKAYARERPEVAALWCFGIGFVLGWKLKPW